MAVKVLLLASPGLFFDFTLHALRPSLGVLLQGHISESQCGWMLFFGLLDFFRKQGLGILASGNREANPLSCRVTIIYCPAIPILAFPNRGHIGSSGRSDSETGASGAPHRALAGRLLPGLEQKHDGMRRNQTGGPTAPVRMLA